MTSIGAKYSEFSPDFATERLGRVAIAHEWLQSRAGSEKMFERISSLLPDADLFALANNIPGQLEVGGRTVHEAFPRWLSGDRPNAPWKLPFMPLAWHSRWRSLEYDTVITSSHAFARQFRPARSARHFCYCYTPMRYAWTPEIDGRSGRLGRSAAGVLRSIDRSTVQSVESFAAISQVVRGRIQQFYNRDSVVLYPAVDTKFFRPAKFEVVRSRFLCISRFVPYKRAEEIIRAANAAGVPLTVAGSGPLEARLRSLSTELVADVEFVISPSDEELRGLYNQAQAVIFLADEDFGIVPVEAQACGTPVIAYRHGAVVETVRDRGPNVLVPPGDFESLVSELRNFVGASALESSQLVVDASRFATTEFDAALRTWLSNGAIG